jgi:hypothetical protein
MGTKKGCYLKAICQVLAGLIFSLFLWQPSFAVPDRLNFQGALTSATGTSLSDGTYLITFSLYDVASGGTPLWTEVQSVALLNGVFSVELGSVNAITPDLFTSDSYLGIAVDSDAEMSPRRPLLSVGYAFKADDADTLDGLDSTELGDITAVNTGAGLTGGGASGDLTLIADTSYIQRRVSSCVAGSSIRVINADGTVICETDDDSGGDITEVLAGTGLAGGGNIDSVMLSADTAYLQRRIASNCTAGSSIRVINADGTVICETDMDSGGDIQGVVAGTGLTGGGTTGTVTMNAAIPFSLTSAATGSTIRGFNTYTGLNSGYGVFGSMLGDYGSGVYGYASGAGNGVFGYSKEGIGVNAATGKSNAHAGYFSSSVGVGLPGASLYAHSNSTSGIALWAHNDNDAGTDAALVISHDGTGPLMKGFGGDGGNEEIRIDNNGSLHIYSDTGLEAIRLTPDGGGYFEVAGQYNVGVYAKYTYDESTMYGRLAGGGAGATGYYSALSYGQLGTSSYGVYGQNGVASGYGGRFYAYGTNATGIYAQCTSSGGWAGIFRGKVKIQNSGGQTVVEIGEGLDYAEGFDVTDPLTVEPGSVMILDPDNPGNLAVSHEPYDKKVAGIIAGANKLNSGVRLGAGQFDHDVALAGRVYCNVDASQQAVEIGDMLTTSSLPGYAMPASDPSLSRGAILGKAMQKIEKGNKGKILVLVTLQ